MIMGRLIPAGIGLEYYRHVKIAGEDDFKSVASADFATRAS